MPIASQATINAAKCNQMNFKFAWEYLNRLNTVGSVDTLTIGLQGNGQRRRSPRKEQGCRYMAKTILWSEKLVCGYYAKKGTKRRC